MADLEIAPGIFIPADALDFRAVRAGGPGGQHVNKVSSKVELRLQIGRIVGISSGALERLVRLAGARLTLDGEILVTASESRHQFQNRQIAEEKVVDLVRRSLVAPRPRRPTKPTRGSKERRLDTKKLDSHKKAARRTRGDD
jgi:ribosome-associated protein